MESAAAEHAGAPELMISYSWKLDWRYLVAFLMATFGPDVRVWIDILACAQLNIEEGDMSEIEQLPEVVNFAGKTVVVTGTLTSMTRNEAKALLVVMAKEAEAKEAEKRHRLVLRKQEKLLYVCFHVLLNLAEEPAIEKKMAWAEQHSRDTAIHITEHFSSDSEHVVGTANSATDQLLYIWDMHGHLINILGQGDKVKDGALHFACHPTRPILACCARSGSTYI